jgi:hypothetical protein
MICESHSLGLGPVRYRTRFMTQSYFVARMVTLLHLQQMDKHFNEEHEPTDIYKYGFFALIVVVILVYVFKGQGSDG